MFFPSASAQIDPDKLAYQMMGSGETVTFRQLEARSNQGAHLFRQCGVGIGDHVAILMENTREFLEICFAADRAGIYYTTINHHLMPHEIEYIVQDCGAKLFITSLKFATLSAWHETLPNVHHMFCVGGTMGVLQDWQAACESQPVTPISDEMQGLDMLYSSGTTGRPKGILWPLIQQKPGGHTMLQDLLCGLFGYARDSRYLCPAPLYHAAPLRHSMSVIKQGGSCFIMEKFDAQTALRIIEEKRITHSQWVPTMFVRMLKLDASERNYDVSSLVCAVHAAAPCPVDVKEKMIAWWGPILHEYYAGTENNGFCAIKTSEWLSHKGSVGRAILGELHICDEYGHELPIGAEGEVYFANGHPFSYHNDAEKTAASRNAQGWTTLGDIGRLDHEGYLYLVDRKSFLIISGGVNIYPQEIEDVILAHPAVTDVAVIGVHNEDLGEEVKAVVQASNTYQANEVLAADILALCKSKLPTFKCPKSIDFWPELPRQPTGKIFKRVIKQHYQKNSV